MTKKNPFYSEKGITLVELVVAMGLAVLVMIVLAQMSGVSDKMFNQGEEKSHNQMHMRVAADEITKNLRYAKNLEMLGDTDRPTAPYVTGPTGLDEDYSYIFFNDPVPTSDIVSSLIVLEHNGTNWVPKSHLEDRIDVDITKSFFSLNDVDKSVHFEITDKSIKHLADTDQYTLKTTINLQNAESYGPVVPPAGSPTNYKGIKYKK